MQNKAQEARTGATVSMVVSCVVELGELPTQELLEPCCSNLKMGVAHDVYSPHFDK